MFFRVYRLAQILSLDIVIGVVILLRFFCVQFRVNPGWEVFVLLGAAVWLIYTFDHLRDAENSPNSARERYVFHRKYKKMLIVASAVVLLISAPLIFFVPITVLVGGILLSTFSILYLLIQRKLSRLLFKELYVALVYSAGVLLVPIVLSGTFDLILFLLLFQLTFLNLIIFSWFEKEEDLREGFRSIATQMEADKLEKLMFTLVSLGLALSLLSFEITHIYFIVGFTIYASLIHLSKRFRRNYLYRAIGDGVFLLPIVFEWI
ncbi:hypothetical protein [Ekhidna sp.]|uniref:hypothetical protein n=1 Tax=Ekhidna sp. TaxID=2608089 RepID=UPI003BA94C66